MQSTWLLYVLMAGLCWGTYVPLIAFGGKNMGEGSMFDKRYAAFLCVGIAYFVIAIAFPIIRAYGFGGKIPDQSVGWTFSCLAGVAGALGALGVVFATGAAAANDRIYIAPLIFTLAPLINTVVSLFWHPTSANPLHFAMPEQMPSWKLFVGVILVGIGAGLVLLSKEESEVPNPAAAAAPSQTPPAQS